MFVGLWLQESGNPSRDAAYLRPLPLELRRRELARLERVHGKGYRWDVERQLRDNTGIAPEPTTPDAPRGNSREALLASLRAIRSRST